jgi:hypothetical protein
MNASEITKTHDEMTCKHHQTPITTAAAVTAATTLTTTIIAFIHYCHLVCSILTVSTTMSFGTVTWMCLGFKIFFALTMCRTENVGIVTAFDRTWDSRK